MIAYERDENGVVTLTFDMPDRAQNVFNQGSIDALGAAIARVTEDADCTGVIVTSAKKDFIAGADLNTVEDMAKGGRSAEELHAGAGALGDILRKLETAGKPVVAAINGTALGGGFEVCLACHHRIVADSSRIKLGLPEATLGLLPGAGGTQRLPRIIGVQASLPLLMEGKPLRPGKALKTGIVHQVVPAAELMDAARAWLATGPSATQPWDVRGFKIPHGGPDEVANIFMVASAIYAEKTYGNYPAGKAILSSVHEGIKLDIDSALAVEKRYFVSLLLDPVAGAMIRTLFLNMQKAQKLVRRPEGFERRPPKKIGVLGAGLMGAGIAYSSAKAGIQVVLLDRDQASADKGKGYSAKREEKAISRKRSTPEKMARILEHIHATADYADLAGCELIVEAVFEDRDVKATVTQQAVAVVGDTAVFGSNTSTLPITGLAEASPHPERFIGLHFFSPVEKMPLVEVIVARQTSEETLAWALDYVQALGKTPIVVNDSRGFYTSRVFGTYLTEGIVMLSEGIVPALIENAGKASGMPMPPLGLADQVGLQLMHQVGVQTKADLGDATPHNPSTPVLEKLVVDGGRFGAKNGKGFYDYGEDGKRLWAGISDLYTPADTQPTSDDLVERFLFVQAIEAARCVDAGVLRAIEDADIGAILGWGFSAYTGGPLSFIDGMGVAAFVARADELAEAYGERFSPPPLLRTMVVDGHCFYA
jgi:3-hydroxyacyl-CoA dehydrogenase/enoyl-CoA hydratase/3-hydroxybutyryl-CoA epimerase